MDNPAEVYLSGIPVQSPLDEEQAQRLACWLYVKRQNCELTYDEIMYIMEGSDPEALPFEGSIHGETVAQPYGYQDGNKNKPTWRVPRNGV